MGFQERAKELSDSERGIALYFLCKYCIIYCMEDCLLLLFENSQTISENIFSGFVLFCRVISRQRRGVPRIVLFIMKRKMQKNLVGKYSSDESINLLP